MRTSRVALSILMAALTLLTAACSSQPAAGGEISVMAAASLSGAFQDLGKQFEKDHPGVIVRFNFAGSQQLAQQLAGGAPADVFASASQKYMDAAVDSERVAPGRGAIFARNRLVVIFPAGNPARVQSLADLARPGLQLVLAAREVPAGQYALAMLDQAVQAGSYGTDFKERVLKNVASYEENVKAVLTKVSLGEADAGIVYVSDTVGVQGIAQLEIPDALNVVASYPIAVLKDSSNSQMAAAFVDLVLSPVGQAVLEKWGFLPGAE